MAEGFVGREEEGTLLTLRVSPGARSNSIEGVYGDSALKIKVAAPPVDGKANDEVRRYLATLLDVPRSRLQIIRGLSSREKVVLIRDVAPDAVLNALSSRTA